jgi:hypothetical protein
MAPNSIVIAVSLANIFFVNTSPVMELFLGSSPSFRGARDDL